MTPLARLAFRLGSWVLLFCSAAAGVPAPASDASAATKNCDGAGVVKAVLTATDGVQVAAFVQGTGPTGIVLVHQVNRDHCGWSDEARSLADHGDTTVISIDLRGYGASGAGKGADARAYPRDIAAAVAYARSKRVQRVVLMGASMGGSAVVVAATQISPRVDAVVAVSAPGNFNGQNAMAAAPKVKIPVRYVAAKDDGSAASTAVQLDRASAASPDHAPVVFAKGGHGWNLVRPGSQAERAVLDFLDSMCRSSSAKTC